MVVAPKLSPCLCRRVCAAQQVSEPHRETVVVTGVYEPLALDEAGPLGDRVAGAGTQPSAQQPRRRSREDPSLDLRRRAPGGVQADLSIRGSATGQSLVLLNGMRLK